MPFILLRSCLTVYLFKSQMDGWALYGMHFVHFVRRYGLQCGEWPDLALLRVDGTQRWRSFGSFVVGGLTARLRAWVGMWHQCRNTKRVYGFASRVQNPKKSKFDSHYQIIIATSKYQIELPKVFTKFWFPISREKILMSRVKYDSFM